MSSGEQIIAIVGEAVQSLGLRLMMVGAASRDFWLKQFQVRANIRTTHDVDLACWVATWEEYQTLMDLLLAGGKLRKDSRGIKHRLWLRDEIAVDLVPFGGIENAHGEFAWPPHFDRTVNVLGFRAAYGDAETVSIGGAELRIIRPHWLALLKMNAYTDNQDRIKDLTDLYFLADNYFDLIDVDKHLYSANAPDADILATDNFDLRIGGATLIARHCRLSDAEATASLQNNVSQFNADGKMTTLFARQNGISLELADAMLDELINT